MKQLSIINLDYGMVSELECVCSYIVQTDCYSNLQIYIYKSLTETQGPRGQLHQAKLKISVAKTWCLYVRSYLCINYKQVQLYSYV